MLRWYEPLVVPGLLQTEEYARAILSARPDGNLDDLDEQVAARLARQAILDRTGAPQLWCILDEGVLHRAIGGGAATYQQAEEPVSRLINDFGPPMASPAAARHGPPRPSSIWNATCGTCATPLARRSARTLLSAAAGCWTAEP